MCTMKCTRYGAHGEGKNKARRGAGRVCAGRSANADGYMVLKVRKQRAKTEIRPVAI
ncbi:hypothetical protein DSM19430T_22900 [Desulfovibrio psychrotolerans]|uniref:Uncharacterized protein n=1 Tax=Desulfovibrio psychrotolerans TaxID=415242 RepID=A0A7J0BV73_9BACT|nr:hypothetical protein DSM19430T_22900 [Desulfovibrio psychrotolerans]